MATPITNEERRWMVIGICLTKVLTPALRNVLATEMPKWHRVLCQPPLEIDKQVYGGETKNLPPSTWNLNYKNINNNSSKPPHARDYSVKYPLSLAKLFVLPYMSMFTGFDDMDLSAVLSVISEAAPFSGSAAHAQTLRSDIRNEWAHCKFATWTNAKFTASFQSMKMFLKSINLPLREEQKVCDELESWKEKGFQLCFGQPVNAELLALFKGQLNELLDAVQTWALEKEQMTGLIESIRALQLNMNEQIRELHVRVENVEIQVSTLQKITTNQLLRYSDEGGSIPYVFNAPLQNRYFAGRTEELEKLKRILKVDETFYERKVRVAALCGLGGIGKTCLATEYAHSMKDFYKGGVYWFSAEDDARLHKAVNKIHTLLIPKNIDECLGSFDLNLPNILRKISTTRDPCLIVLDSLDQPNLSSNMMEFLSFSSQLKIFGHLLVLTRRNPTLLVNEMSVFEDDSCLLLKCFEIHEAKQFIFSRTKSTTRDENAENIVECLCEELGGLPLALEQAGAYIQTRRCSFSLYLEEFKAKRLQLLRRQKACATGNDLTDKRLSVYTTWDINTKYIKNCQDGQAAVRFMNACSFFNGNEIEEELINVGSPEVEDAAFQKCVSSPLGRRDILKILTDFSLFTFVDARSVSTHRLIQEVVIENLDPELKAESLLDAVRLLSYAFSKCPSPSDCIDLDDLDDKEQSISFREPDNPSRSHFYFWSKLCTHGHHLCRKVNDLLLTPGSVCLDSVWLPQTAKIFYKCAVHLSANHAQEKAKRSLNFAYRILDWLPLPVDEMVEFFFPLPIPLPKPFQEGIKQNAMPSIVSIVSPLQPLTENVTQSEASDLDLEEKVNEFRLDGNRHFQEGSYNEALSAYSSAIDLAQCWDSAFDPSLLTERGLVYVKLERYKDALKDANDYITRRPDCWMGYAGKALALNGLNENIMAKIAASLAFYRKRDIFSTFPPFMETFSDLQKRVFICDSVDEFWEALISPKEAGTGVFNILVLPSGEYILNARTVSKPWDNCIVVGTKTNSSVTLKSNSSIRLSTCMLANLSFIFENGQVHCLSGSFVKVLNCKFISNDSMASAVSSEGEFNAYRCIFTNEKYSGLCIEKGKAVVVDCSFCNNGIAGLQVRHDGTLRVKSSRVYKNRDGLVIGPNASKCVVKNCVVHHNRQVGILVMNSKNVTIKRNNCFDNYDHGICTVNSETKIKENKSFDNCLWGIWSENSLICKLSWNSVFRNKAGGYRAVGEASPQNAVDMNKIYDNYGPGFVETVGEREAESSARSLQSVKGRKGNQMYNNRENENVSKLNLSVPFCSHCRKKCEPKWCENCFTSGYCSQECQEKHGPKHEKMCKILREKSSYLITCMEKADDSGTTPVEGFKDIGPRFSPPPHRDGKRFVVKVHTALKQSLAFIDILYDRSFELCETFESREIDELLEEFGVQCERKHVEKKLFFYCLFEDGLLRLFTNEFPEFQDW